MKAPSDTSLFVSSIFLTVDGEANAWGPGMWSVFIRLQGCDVGCPWCDTAYTWNWNEGKNLEVMEIIDVVRQVGKGCLKVTITGGEPLQQYGEAFRMLLSVLLKREYKVSIETSGTVKFKDVALVRAKRDHVSLVVDYKMPSAKVRIPMRPFSEFYCLNFRDVVKVVVANELEVEKSVSVIHQLKDAGCAARFYLSPVHDALPPAELFNMMKNFPGTAFLRMSVGINLQLHKYMFSANFREGEEGGGVDFHRRNKGPTSEEAMRTFVQGNSSGTS